MKKVNIKNFKQTLSKFTTGITIVCVEKNNKIFGKTVNSFNSLSLKPPLVLFSLGNYSSSIKTFIDCKYLTINILSKNQKNISDHFSKKNPPTEKIDFIKGHYNTSFIRDSIGYLECKLTEKIKKGDHIIFICKVINVGYNNKLKPLSYFNSKYLL
tara:strand:- start:63 stop:530 length:468 start_codon:yes stop_codon:yes gene_type:complete